VSLVHHAIPLEVVDRPLTWAAVHDDRILAVHGWGLTSAIGMESYSFAGRRVGRIPSIRTDVFGAAFPGTDKTAFLIGDKRLLVLDLDAAKVTARHPIGDVRFLGAREDVIVLSTATELRLERVSTAGVERLAQVNTRRDEMIGATAISPSRWWVGSKRKLYLLDLEGATPAVISTYELPFAADQVLIDPDFDIAIVMATSVGRSGSTACSIRLRDGYVLARTGIPTGRMVWDEEARVAILDEKGSLVHRLDAALSEQEVLPMLAMRTDRFPVRTVQVSPAEVLIFITPPGD
jgi:hypothetical protein